jgi:hypothetical protein
VIPADIRAMPSIATRLICLFLLAAATGGAQAEKMYRWTDAQGKVHFSDRPQVNSAKPIEVKPGSGPGNAGAAAAASEEGGGNKAAAAAPRNKAGECERLRGQLDTYRSAQRIIEKDSLGNEREYSAGDRDKLVQLTEKSMRDACGGGEG